MSGKLTAQTQARRNIEMASHVIVFVRLIQSQRIVTVTRKNTVPLQHDLPYFSSTSTKSARVGTLVNEMIYGMLSYGKTSYPCNDKSKRRGFTVTTKYSTTTARLLICCNFFSLKRNPP
jgi:hypothetical protein